MAISKKVIEMMRYPEIERIVIDPTAEEYVGCVQSAKLWFDKLTSVLKDIKIEIIHC